MSALEYANSSPVFSAPIGPISMVPSKDSKYLLTYLLVKIADIILPEGILPAKTHIKSKAGGFVLKFGNGFVIPLHA